MPCTACYDYTCSILPRVCCSTSSFLILTFLLSSFSLPPSLPQLLQDLEEMRGDLKQALKQKNRAEAAVAAMEEELNNVKSAQRRSGSRPATEDSRKEIQK